MARLPTPATTRRSSTRRNAGDTIAATGAPARASVTGLAATVDTAHADATTRRAGLNALGGDDRIDASALGADTMKLTRTAGPATTRCSAAAATTCSSAATTTTRIDGNQGNDTALMGAGDDRFTWDPGDGSDIIEGQAGSDMLAFNGANVAEAFDVSANGGRVRFFRNVANITMDLNDVERDRPQRARRRRHG